MLIYLADYLAQFESGFSVFQYQTLRIILSVLTALVVSFVIGPAMIRKLATYKGQPVRDDGPKTHFAKAGTPTMGGALILVAVSISTLLMITRSWSCRIPGVLLPAINICGSRCLASQQPWRST